MSESIPIEILSITKLKNTTDKQWELVKSVLEEECSASKNLKLVERDWYYQIGYIFYDGDDMGDMFPCINKIMYSLSDKFILNKDVEISVLCDIQMGLAKMYYNKGKYDRYMIEPENKTDEEQEIDSYDLIRHLRKAQEEFFDKHNLEGIYWEVDLHVKELSSCEKREVLKNIYDEDRK